MDAGLVDDVVETARAVVASGAISAIGHGNVSLRATGADEMYFFSAPSLRGIGGDAVVRVGLDGVLREGQLPPIQGAVVAMHTALDADQPDIGCVIDTHSPSATAFAVANRPIDCWIEALAMFGPPQGVPVAAYGPRGSEQAVANIRAALIPGTPAVLLANTGSSTSTGHLSWRSWSAGTSRRPPWPPSTPSGWEARFPSRRRCGRLLSSGRWPSKPLEPVEPEGRPKHSAPFV